MKFMVELTPGEDGWIVASCPSLPGCHSQGKTRDEALSNIQEAILAWLEAEEIEARQAVTAGRELATVEVMT
jgi:predicted RNase H-like HicB family nuclease